MKKLVLISTLVATCLLLNGCATMFGDKNRTVSITSEPAGAQVLLNGQPSGFTPTQLTVANVTGNYIQLQKAGYVSTNTPMSTSFQKIGWLNILFWPGFIVDYSTGDMMRLDNPSIIVKLQPMPQNATPVASYNVVVTSADVPAPQTTAPTATKTPAASTATAVAAPATTAPVASTPAPMAQPTAITAATPAPVAVKTNNATNS